MSHYNISNTLTYLRSIIMRAFLLAFAYTTVMVGLLVGLYTLPPRDLPVAAGVEVQGAVEAPAVVSWYKLRRPDAYYFYAVSPIAPAYQKSELVRLRNERPFMPHEGDKPVLRAMFTSVMYYRLDYWEAVPTLDSYRGALRASLRVANRLALTFHGFNIENWGGREYDEAKVTKSYMARWLGKSHAKVYKTLAQDCNRHFPGDADCISLLTQLIWF